MRLSATYLNEAGEQVALGFIDALEKTFAHLSRYPASGSPRYTHELDLPGLRSRVLPRYPHSVFYVERDDYVDVWRVLHGMRDIPRWLHEGDKIVHELVPILPFYQERPF